MPFIYDIFLSFTACLLEMENTVENDTFHSLSNYWEFISIFCFIGETETICVKWWRCVIVTGPVINGIVQAETGHFIVLNYSYQQGLCTIPSSSHLIVLQPAS